MVAAAATRLGVRRAAYAVSTVWLLTVIVAAQVADDATAPFRWVGQVVALAAAVIAGALLVGGRRRLDRWPASSTGAP